MNSNSKKILLIGNYIPDNQKSMRAYAVTLLEILVSNGYQSELIFPSSFFVRQNSKRNLLVKWMAYIDKYIIFPFVLVVKAKGFEKIHICDHSNSMYYFFLPSEKVSITCHDVIAIQAAQGKIDYWQVGIFGKILQFFILKALQKIKKIICVSDLTKRDLIAMSESAVENSIVIHNFYNYDYCVLSKELDGNNIIPKAFIENKYIIHVGSDLHRKNRIKVLQIFIELKKNAAYKDINLLFVGPPLNKEMSGIVPLDMVNDIFAITNISNKDLNKLYSAALFMIFPSLHEGFGWPVAEAQKCGCPVFASNIDPMPEVGGDGAKYFDPRADANIIVDLIVNSDLSEMRKLGFINSDRFTKQTYFNNFISSVYQ